MRLTLPLFLTQKNKQLMTLLGAAIGTVIYLIPNHFPLFPPRYLPMGFIDQWVPFIPVTFWIYISEYLFYVVVYWNCKSLVNLNKYLYAVLSLQAFSVLIFLVWPTTYPRELFPLDPESVDSFTYWNFSVFRMADTPANCCPSLHVSSVLLSTLIFLEDQTKKFPFFFIWGIAIALSTLTTKQHYLIDVIAGFGLSILFYIIFYRLISYTPVQESPSNTTTRSLKI